jgi:lysyl-tRNA synthetase class 1
VWHIHSGAPPKVEMPVSFALLLNLATVANAETKDVLWGFLRRHIPDVAPETHPELDRLLGYALRYFQDFVKPHKRYRLPDDTERGALQALSDALGELPPEASAEDIQAVLYDVGRAVPRYQNVAAKGATAEKPGVSLAWFNAIYQILLGEEKGPRFGSFVALYGIDNTRKLIAKALGGELAGARSATGA